MAKTAYSETTGEVVAPAAPVAPVPIVDPTGAVVEVDGANLEQALSAGSRVATAEDIAAQRAATYRARPVSERLGEKFGLSPVAAAIGGAALQAVVPSEEAFAWSQAGLEGATAGLGQVAIKAGIAALMDDKSAEQYAKEAQRIRTEYPGLRVAGNVGGALAGAAISGGAGIGTIGGAVEGMAGRGLSRLGLQAGESALGRAGIAALKAGAGAAAEGAVFGAGQELSEEMLDGSAELNAQKIVAAGAKGGLYGAILGGGLAGAGSLAASGARKTLAAFGSNSGSLRDMANEQLWKALDPTVKFTRELEARVPGGVKAGGEVLNKYRVAGETISDAYHGGYAEEMLPKITGAKEQVGRAIGEIHATPATMTLEEVMGAFDRKVAPLESQLGAKGAVRSAQELKEELAGLLMAKVPQGTTAKTVEELYKTPIPIQDVIAQRKALDNLVYKEAKALDPNMRVGLLREIRGELEDSIVKSIDDAATKAGNPEVAATLRTLKRDYQVLSIAESAAENTSSRYATNRNVSLSGQIWGASAMAAGGTPLTGIATAVGHQILKTRGNALANVALNRLADLGDAMRAIQQTNQRLDSAAKGVVSGGERVTKVLPAASARVPLRERYDRAVKDVANLRANAPQLAEQAANDRGIAGAPKLSAAVLSQTLRSATYLMGRLPPTTARQPIGGREMPARQSAEEMQRFVDTYEAVRDPGAAFEQMSRGRVKREYAAALKNTSPELFQELQRKTLEEVVRRQESGKPLSLNERLRLGIVLEIPTDPALEPATLQALQSTFDSAKSKEGRQAPPRPSGTSKPVPNNGIDRIETL